MSAVAAGIGTIRRREGSLTATWSLVRLALRRDRVVLPIWVFWLAAAPVLQVVGTADLFPTAAQRATYAATLGSPALVALYGPVFGTSVGALAITRSGFAPVIVGLATLLLVIRHTRTEEEAGRRELVGSTVVGRHAPLAAAFVVATIASLGIGVLLIAGMLSQDMPVAGSVAVGLAYALVGLAFAAVGGVAAQLTEGAGGARAIAISALGVAFLLRLAGDVSDVTGRGLPWLSWLSPIGWGQQVRPFADERWWVLGLPLVFTAATMAVAVAISARRDVGAGVFAPRPGPAEASPRLRSPFALAWRLQRGALLGWSAGFVAIGLVLGAVADGVANLVADSPQLEEVFERLGGRGALADLYLGASLGILALIASGYSISATLRLRSEEASLRAENVLSSSVGRIRWAASHLVLAFAGPAVVLAVGGLATGVAYGVATGEVLSRSVQLTGAALVHLPAVWVLSGIAVLTFGVLPRLVGISWAALGAFVLLGQIGAVLRLPQALLDLSPFGHVPVLPGQPFRAEPLVSLTTIAVALTALGLAVWRRRDIAASG